MKIGTIVRHIDLGNSHIPDGVLGTIVIPLGMGKYYDKIGVKWQGYPFISENEDDFWWSRAAAVRLP